MSLWQSPDLKEIESNSQIGSSMMGNMQSIDRINNSPRYSFIVEGNEFIINQKNLVTEKD